MALAPSQADAQSRPGCLLFLLRHTACPVSVQPLCHPWPLWAGLLLTRLWLSTQGNRPSCLDQEGRRGTDEVMPGTSVFPSSETSVLGNLWGRIKGAKYRIALQPLPEAPAQATAVSLADGGGGTRGHGAGPQDPEEGGQADRADQHTQWSACPELRPSRVPRVSPDVTSSITRVALLSGNRRGERHLHAQHG